MPDVFISYSRLDGDFAHQLAIELEKRDYDVWIDWEDIARASDWLREILDGIDSADTVVFLTSENSLISQVCNQELEYARQKNKRIIPLILRDITKNKSLEQIVKASWFDAQWDDPPWMNLAQENWQHIRTLNWIFIQPDEPIEQILDELTGTLETDLDYVKIHTRLLMRAQDWKVAGESASFLLSGEEIEGAEKWLADGQTTNKKPEPSDLHIAYIHASRQRDDDEKRERQKLIEAREASMQQAEIARQEREQAQQQAEAANRASRRSRQLAGGAIIATVIAMLAGIFAFNQSIMANQAVVEVANQREIAEQNAMLAMTSEAEARVQVDLAATRNTNIVTQQAQLQSDVYSYRMAGQTLLNTDNENLALAYAFESVSVDDPPRDARSIFYEMARLSRNRMTLGHNSSVYSIAFTSDDTLMATATNNGIIYIWNTATSEVIASLNGHTGFVGNLAFVMDDTYLISSDAVGKLIVWDMATGEPYREFDAHAGLIMSMDWDAERGLLVTGGDDGSIKFWDMNTWRELDKVSEQGASVTQLVFSPDGSFLVSSDAAGRILLWDTDSAELIEVIEDGNVWIRTIDLSPDGMRLIAGNDAGEVMLWDMESLRPINRLSAHVDWVNEVMFSPDGSTYFSASDDSEVKLWDGFTGQSIKTFSNHNNWIRQGTYSPDGIWIATADIEGVIWLWNISGEAENIVLTGHTNTINDLKFQNNGQILASVSEDMTARIWDMSIPDFWGQQVYTDSPVFAVDISPDLSWIAVGTGSGSIELWNIETGEKQYTFSAHTEAVWDLMFSPDAATLASASQDGTVKLWDVRNGTELETFRGHNDEVFAVKFNADGSLLATGSADGTVQLRSMQTGAVPLTLIGHDSGVINIAFSADGLILASTNDDQSVHLWDVTTGEEIQTISGFDANVLHLLFSPDSTMLATATLNGQVTLWTTDTYEKIHTFDRSGSVIAALAFDADSRLLAAAGDERAIFIYDVTTFEQMETLLGHTDVVSDLIYSPNNVALLSGSYDGSFVAWFRLNDVLQWVQRNRTLLEIECALRVQLEMRVLCDEKGEYPTRTPIPALTERPVTVPTLDFAPFYANPTWIVEASYTPTPSLTPTNTLTPTATHTTTPTASPIPAGAMATLGDNMGQIEPGGGQVWLYEAQAGDRLNLQVISDVLEGEQNPDGTPVNEFDTYLLVYAPDGTLLDFNDDSPLTSTTNSVLENLLLPVDGIYQISVRSYNDQSGGSYTLIIEDATIERTATPTATLTPLPTLTPRPSETPASGD